MKLINLLKWLPFRSRKKPLTTIVLHATAGGSAGGAVSTLVKRGLSYHAIIADENDPEGDGTAIKCVPDSKVAFHAGESRGPDGQFVNNYSLGLSFTNMNDGRDPYSPRQIDAALERCHTWAMAYPSIKWVTTHYAISPGRKSDPLAFPVRHFMDRLNTRLKAAGRTPLVFWAG